MDLLNFMVLKLFLGSIFFFRYVHLQNTPVSAKAIFYNSTQQPYMCLSLTWLPFDVPQPNCNKKDNAFRGNMTGHYIYSEQENCKKFSLNTNTISDYKFNNYFEPETLHQLSYLCGKAKCEDLESEVNLDILWEKINTENKAKKLCQNFGDIKNVFTDSDCPFSTRIDVQYYFYKKHQESQITEELCVDRFGRKYPPPEGLGGKCVVFQHEFEKDGKQITEFFMPIEQRDMVQRILQYPYTHEIRKNATTLNRLLPKTDVQIRLQETNCTTLHYYGGMFFHCIYNPDQSHLFLAKETDYFNCPKNEHLSLTSEIGLPVGMVYSIQKIDSDRYEFSNFCYVSIEFIPKPQNETGISSPFDMEMSFIGGKKNNCPTPYFVPSISKYWTVMEEAVDGLCPWDKNTSYTLCFQLSSKEIMTNFGKLFQRLIDVSRFDACYYQSPRSRLGCYIAVDPTIYHTFRLPSKWVVKLERNELIATKNIWKGPGTVSAFVYFTSEMKKSCLTKLNGMSESPINGISLDRVKSYFAANTKSFVRKCEKYLCDNPNSTDWIPEMKTHNEENPLNCFEGLRDKSIDTVKTNSSRTFFCSVQLSIYHEHGQKLRKYSFSKLLPTDFPIEPKDCWTFKKLSDKMKNPEIDASKIDSCHHDFKTQTVKCCCRAAKDPCNKVELVDDYLEIANTAAKENQQRILDGCRFHANISRSNEETCKIDSVRYDREMRCYGIFEFPATDKDGKDLIKPKLIKENCYWPHPQYHDQYSVFCSNAFFDIDELVEDKCISVVINDFTSSSTPPSMENNLHRTMILCCNSGVYPDRRESILSRSVVVL